MSDWIHCSVGTLCDEGLAQLQTGPFGTQLHAYDYLDDGVPVVPTEAIRGRRIDRTVLPKISPAKAAELERHQLREGDILFARRGVQATGHIGYVRENEAGFICGTGAIRLRLAKNDNICAEFLSHVFANPASVAWFKSHAIGATMPNLNEGIIRSFTLSLPPIGEQKAIANILSAIDDKVQLNRRTSRTLEELAEAMFRDWFVDFGPTRAKAEGRKPYLRQDVWELFPATVDDYDRPVGWMPSTIGEEVSAVGGATPSTKDDRFWGGDLHWATPRDLSNLPGPVLLDTERRITKDGLSRIGSGLLPIGTVLLSSRAPIGYLAIAEVPTAINQGFIAMICKGRLSNMFVWLWTKANLDAILQNANGSTFQEISKANFRPIRVAVPDDPIRKAFDGVVRPLYERIVEAEQECRALAQTRAFLLPGLTSGALRLREAERVLGEAV